MSINIAHLVAQELGNQYRDGQNILFDKSKSMDRRLSRLEKRVGELEVTGKLQALLIKDLTTDQTPSNNRAEKAP